MTLTKLLTSMAAFWLMLCAIAYLTLLQGGAL
jgi:hypothetical protein